MRIVTNNIKPKSSAAQQPLEGFPAKFTRLQKPFYLYLAKPSCLLVISDRRERFVHARVLVPSIVGRLDLSVVPDLV